MGLYDYVRCEVPLPDGFTGELQTKDFDDAYMETYTITKDGRLTQRYASDRQPAPESEWKHVGADDPLRQFWHEQSKWKLTYSERDTNYHGMLNFYGSSGDEWHEYNAKFTDGRLVKIDLVADSDKA